MVQNGKKTQATMRDVAEIAGVSIATISRALSCPEKLAPATRNRVEEAISHAGYQTISRPPLFQPNDARVILIVVPEHHRPLFIEVLQHLTMTAAAQDYAVLTISTEKLPTNVLHYLCVSKQIGGILLFGAESASAVQQNKSLSLLPKALAYGFDSQLNIASVNIDNLSAAFHAVTHLYQAGHHRIACLSGPEQVACYRDRKSGYLRALKRWGIAIEQCYIIDTEISFSAGAEAISKLFALPLPPSALFCHSDLQAIGALHQAKRLNLTLPKALSVVGFDNLEVSQYCDPPLTTMSYSYQSLAERSLRLLIQTMEGQQTSAECHQLECQLIQRGSTIPYQR